MIKGRTVRVHDDNVEKAIRKLKKKVSNDGRLWEVRQREQYDKRTVITSNLRWEEVANESPRISSLLSGYQEVKLIGADRRRGRK